MKRKKHYKKTAVSVILTAVLAFSALNIPVVFAEENDIIVFSDAVLKQALLDAGADTSGDSEITEGELSALEGTLSLGGLGITDLAGMEHAAGISVLGLADNRIRSIAPLVGLTLTDLDVSSNYLDITGDSGDMADIQALTDAGCTVVYSPQKAIPVDGVSLDISSLTLCTGDTATLTAIFNPADAANQNTTWASDGESVATVADGAVTAVSVGTATVTVTTQDGGYTDTCDVAVKSPDLETSAYTIDSGYLTGVAKLTSPGQLKANFGNDPENIVIYDLDGAVYDGERVGTGMKVKLIIGGTVRDELTVIVNGDTNGDGMISITDYTLTRLHILGLKSLQNVFLTAGDTSGDGIVSITDYTLIRLDILGLKSIGGFVPSLPAVSDARIRAFLDVALAQQGKPYVWSAEGPDGFDCSGYVYYCLTQVGYSVYRATANTYSHWPSWQYVDREHLQPGDLMFYYSDDPNDGDHIGHIGIYLGNGYHIHASSSYGCVIICKFDGWYDEMFSHGMRVWY